MGSVQHIGEKINSYILAQDTFEDVVYEYREAFEKQAEPKEYQESLN